MKRRPGRPKSDNPKNTPFYFLNDAETDRRLRFLCEYTGKPKAQIARDGIDIQYEAMKKSENST